MWSTCCKSRKATNGETEPLLPQHHDYNQDTAMQRQLHEKLRTYQMFKALASGYMPSTEQVVLNLRALLVSGLLNPEHLAIGNTSRELTRDVKLCIRLLIGILQEKNGENQLQDAIWQLSKANVEVDTARVASRGTLAKAQADAAAARESIRTVTSLLLTNSDFRRLVDDLATIGRMVFADTASALSSAAAEAADQAEPSEEERSNIKASGSECNGASTKDLSHDLEQVSGSARGAAAQTGKAAVQSTQENVFGHYKNTLLYRVKKTVQNLRKRNDYATSVSTITQLIKRYGIIYSRAVGETVNITEEELNAKSDLKRAVRNLWNLIGSFGDRNEWQLVESTFNEVVKHSEKDPEFESLLKDIGNSIQSLLMDPGFFDSADKTIDLLKQRSSGVGSDSALRQDIDEFFQHLGRALASIPKDKSVAKLITATKRLGGDLARAFHETAPAVSEDALNVFLPTLIRSVQHIPIPRLEVSVPELDLLLENVVLEPGHSFRSSSFFPWRLLFTTRNDVEVRKTHSKAANTSTKNVVSITMNGLNISGREFGYWIRVHSPPYIPSLSDEGIASFALDERGIDISLDLEIGRDRIERLVSLLAVRVHIHKLDYTVHKSTWSFMWWMLKPFLKHMVRRVLEKKIAEQIVVAAHILNRELVFARERLRATSIASPQSLATFARAILTSMTPKMDPDVYTRVGVDARREGIFKDVYTPASVMKIWNVEGVRAGEAVEDGDQSGGLHMTWRNGIFDIVSPASAARH
ncbi:hypothetical protein AJ78_08016 [Emergomyces pasteurianus Ep9510]|uniref:HAM1-like N-terminal domain-containing protein n=1 Tax=Emergomyces pasteurianus Ep9510 TaxID=1447872 RepID=A0A1J9P5K4_9EURO|nr:hypothetical protein AJ78_08016 [Emergomyces pasteurianus Ep9510]